MGELKMQIAHTITVLDRTGFHAGVRVPPPSRQPKPRKVTPVLNRSEVMKAAWASYRKQDGAAGLELPFSRELFARHLKSAWAEARFAVWYAEQCAKEAAEPVRVREIKADLLSIEMSDAFRGPQFERARVLRTDLARIAS
jgi:hypothetical protein